MSILDDVERYRHEVVTDTYTTTWREVIGQYKDGDLKIDPEFQRLFRWDIDQQTQYIESILLNIPSPPLFLAANADGGFEVIDGLQRVSTLIRFFSRELFSAGDIEMSPTHENEENDLRLPLVLAAGPIIRSLEGFDMEHLPEALVRTIRYARITIILLEKQSSHRARFEVFKRLNKQGAMLSDQEIRNCTGRMFGSSFPSELRRLAAESVVRSALQLSNEDEKRMRVEEMILRLLAFNHSGELPKHDVSEFLDEFMIHAAEGKFQLTTTIRDRLINTFSAICEAFPDGKAFRHPRGGFSTNLFDVLATGVYANEGIQTAHLQQRKTELLLSEEFREVTGAGSNTRKRMAGRIKLGREWFAA